MQDDVIIYMVYAIVYAVLGGVLLFAGRHAFDQLYAFIPSAVPYLRKVFDAGTPGAIVVETVLNVDPAEVDKIAETIADALTKIAPPPQEVAPGALEAQPKGEHPA